MPTLNDYRQFNGLHWETGSVCNHLGYQGFKAPHTNQPYTEALLLGISGGAVIGYFSFAYEGYDPQGSAALSARQQIKTRLSELKTEILLSFPLNETEVATLRENLERVS